MSIVKEVVFMAFLQLLCSLVVRYRTKALSTHVRAFLIWNLLSVFWPFEVTENKTPSRLKIIRISVFRIYDWTGRNRHVWK